MILLACSLAGGAGGLADARAERAPLKVLALGTSLTHSGGWLKSLEAHLADCLGRSVTALDFGRDGATSEWGIAALDDVIHAKADVVLIEFSINDAALFKGLSLQQSQDNIRKIVHTIKNAQPDVRLFLMTMSPSFGPRAWIRPRMNAYYQAYGSLANELGIGYIDNLRNWHSLTTQELRSGIPDGLHPTPELASRVLLPAITGAIAGTACG